MWNKLAANGLPGLFYLTFLSLQEIPLHEKWFSVLTIKDKKKTEDRIPHPLYIKKI